jgi:protoporphyrinogen oxidase
MSERKLGIMGEKNVKHQISRRQFLKTGLAVSAGSLLMKDFSLLAEPAKPLPYKVSGWSGNDFELAHRLRDGWRPKESSPDERVDVVIIGGGISGLSAAYKLRELNSLVLEGDAKIGGNAKSGIFQGIESNIGSAYYVVSDGEQGDFFRELGLPLKPVSSPVDSWYCQGQWIRGTWEDEAIVKQPPALAKAMTGLKAALQKISDGADFPQTPYEKSSTAALKLDTISFAEWLKPFEHPDLFNLVDSYCYSAMGGSARSISAYGGINFYSEIIGNLYAGNEGNHHIVKAMVKGIERAGANRIRPGCFVYRIEPRADNRAVIHYVNQGQSRAVEAKKVILAVPYYQAGRMIDGLSDSQRYALTCPPYGAYLVANLIFDSVISADSYDTWVSGRTAFEDFIPVGWADKNKPAAPNGTGQIITVFAPCRQATLGRLKMQDQSIELWAQTIVDAFVRLRPDSLAHLQEVHLTRWGHAILVNQVGMFTKWLPHLKKDIGPIRLAHSDGQGLPAVESATCEGLAAARAILAGWK